MTKDEIIAEGRELGYAGQWPDGSLRYQHLPDCPNRSNPDLRCRCGMWPWVERYESAFVAESKAKEAT